MNNGRVLYQLHQLDLEIHEQEAALGEVVRQLEDEGALRLMRERVSDQDKEVAGLEREQRDADAELSTIQAKLKSGEEKAYGGSVKNPRELEAFEREAKVLRKRLGEAEDRSLILMDRVESAQKALAVSREELAALEQGRQEDVQRLTVDRVRREEELSTLGSKRKGLASAMDAGVMKLYESLRATRAEAVAKVERGMCQGCRIALPMSVIQRARLGRNVVQCTSCSRILYVS
ncbi:MAG: zinc ribbon domain-containing protein [Dehalococcoidia bacterium]